MSTKRERFGNAVRRRREQLDLSQLEVWMAGGPSNSTLTAIENGRMESLARSTARKLDHALQWEAGSARRLWEGGEPTPLFAPGLSTRASQILRQQIAAAEVDPSMRDALLQVLDEHENEAG